MEDAILCNARINTIEASDMYLFIDKAFQEKEKRNLLLLVAYLVRCALSVSYYLYFSPKLKKQKEKKWNKPIKACHIIWMKYKT